MTLKHTSKGTGGLALTALKGLMGCNSRHGVFSSQGAMTGQHTAAQSPPRAARQAQEGGSRGQQEGQQHRPLLRSREHISPRYQGPRRGSEGYLGDLPTRTLSMHMLAGMEIEGQAAEAPQGKRRRRQLELGSQEDGNGQGV